MVAGLPHHSLDPAHSLVRRGYGGGFRRPSRRDATDRLSSGCRLDLDREGRPALARRTQVLGFGRAACEIQHRKGIRGARFPVFTRDQPSRLSGRSGGAWESSCLVGQLAWRQPCCWLAVPTRYRILNVRWIWSDATVMHQRDAKLRGVSLRLTSKLGESGSMPSRTFGPTLRV